MDEPVSAAVAEPVGQADPSLGARSGDGVAAFFDMDYTLLRGSSGLLYLRYLRQVGYVPWHRWPAIVSHIVLYMSGLVDYPNLMARLMPQIIGHGEDEAWQLSGRWFEAMLQYYIADGARERIGWHKERGHHVAIISGSTPFAVRPVARALGLGDAFLATRLDIIDGAFTGKIESPACFGPGKVSLARAYAEAQGLDLSRSYFYSDSHSDLPLLEKVGHPVAVNPSRKLARIAAERGWPIERFY